MLLRVSGVDGSDTDDDSAGNEFNDRILCKNVVVGDPGIEDIDKNRTESQAGEGVADLNNGDLNLEHLPKPCDNLDIIPNIFHANIRNDDSEVEIVDQVSSSSDYDTDDVDRLKDKLRYWVVDAGIPFCHVNELLQILRPHFPDLPKDARTLVSTPKQYNLQDVAGGTYHHFGLGNGILDRLSSNQELVSLDNLRIKVNIDGVPLIKSTSDQFWPILGLIENDNLPFVIGIYVGKAKPNDADRYLMDFVQETNDLINNGMVFLDKKYNVSILNFICDTPARSFVKKTKGHTGYSGCDRCTQTGVYVNHRMTFPEVNAPKRTNAMFDEMEDDAHHRGESILKQLGLGN